MARKPKPAIGTTTKPSSDEQIMRSRAQKFANTNFTSIPIVERGGQLIMLTITDRQPNDTLIAVIHPK